MTDSSRVRVGVAGWGNPPAKQTERDPGQTHLSYYAAHFSCVEINSSFYRPHQASTYARWRDETPPHFCFSVKMPRSITHESRLKCCIAEVARFCEAIGHLQPKLGAILVQLPPSLEYDARAVRSFFRNLPRPGHTPVVCEPRHGSWFTTSVDAVLLELGVARVAADPARHPAAHSPGGARRFAYFRWHGTPHLYYSKYADARIAEFADRVLGCEANDAWCVFDNTARHAAWDDALQLMSLLRRSTQKGKATVNAQR
jgi:uncharacterized protein YecE (DUF72 family)